MNYTATTYYNGNKIYYIDGKWYYEDGKESKDNYRPCPKCGKLPINEHDACIANLPGVVNACCGHGIREGYIIFENGVEIRGEFNEIAKYDNDQVIYKHLSYERR